MSTQRYDYPEDEFDVAGRDRAPQGAHRTPRSPWRMLLPFLIVLVAAPLLAWGAVSLLGDDGGESPAPQATTTQEPTEDGATQEEPTDDGATDEATGEATDEPTDEATDEEEPDDDLAEADLTASISVLNGAGVAGLAGQTAETLITEGFTSVAAADYGAGEPATTTLYYNNAELEATAQAVGELLGITALEEAPGATQTVDIAVVLRSDFVG